MQRADADRAYYAALAHRDAELDITGLSITLEQLFEEYLEKVISPKQRTSTPYAPKTIASYIDTICRYLLPHWGKYRIKEFNTKFVQNIHATLTLEYSDYIANAALTQLHKLLSVAMSWSYIEKNAVALSRRLIPSYTTKDKEPMTVAEMRRLINVSANHHNNTLYLVALVLGLRIGELLGLKWEDIDWEAKTIKIRRQVQQVSGKLHIREQTKTSAGNRTLPLTPRIYAQLQTRVRTSEYIFPSGAGTPWAPGSFTRHFKGKEYTDKRRGGAKGRIIGMRQKASLPPTVTPHIFRHSVGARLVDMNIRGEISDAILGHGKKGARGIYGHATIEAMRKVLVELENLLCDDPQ